jgi:DNA-binding transcriptional LysR family regulator
LGFSKLLAHDAAREMSRERGAMTTPPDWVTIKIFLTTLDLGSITRAADRCGIATSAAAKRVQMLEMDCGVPLLERGARGVKPTPAGDIFARHCRGLVDLAARLTSDLKALSVGGFGTVRLHATPSVLAGPELAELLATFAIAKPGVQVELREATSVAILQDLLDGRADLGLITTAARVSPNLEANAWRDDRLLMVVSTAHPLANRASIGFGEVLDQPLIGVLETGAISLLLEDAAQRLGRRPLYRFRVESTDAARRLVAAGHGVTIMPDGVLHGYETSLALRGIPIRERWSHRRLRLVARPANVLPPPARSLLDHLLEMPSKAKPKRR